MVTNWIKFEAMKKKEKKKKEEEEEETSTRWIESGVYKLQRQQDRSIWRGYDTMYIPRAMLRIVVWWWCSSISSSIPLFRFNCFIVIISSNCSRVNLLACEFFIHPMYECQFHALFFFSFYFYLIVQCYIKILVIFNN